LSEYPVLQLPGDRIPENREPLGSKKKLWFRHPTGQEPRLLFKYNRAGTGEDWSEKIAAELAQVLGLPHARVELAMFDEQRGAALVDFTENENVALVHGNEILEFVDPAYPTQKQYRAVEHTVGAVVSALERLNVGLPSTPVPLPEAVKDAFGLFLGYLLLDAWIGNTDRHHENWGVLRNRDEAAQTLVLAPSFDHASSLGRELSDEARTNQGRPLQGSTVERYAGRARSALYGSDGGKRPLHTWQAFREGAAHRRDAADAWLERLTSVPQALVRDVVESVPEGHMSPPAKAFACALLECNAKLLGVR
jgi:hypothetical protein